jgi:hypothetical protein
VLFLGQRRLEGCGFAQRHQEAAFLLGGRLSYAVCLSVFRPQTVLLLEEACVIAMVSTGRVRINEPVGVQAVLHVAL